ncbi:hypothetical protein GTGU_04111 [Trabulsiella guamensis ATCC 49490]|uniref:Uncharacterized protein n=1 Tax=Trabulsiella guamensis ATCC 49490 TaxID=1005994 RepID=A0A084ZQC8_9ENTR|nr:hypothetical protein [Trabulsiella guamensis]KFB99672.1 hypothetical protein GTGU_04111 [Trabulsiella guamensis ATCC 49490]
MTVNYGQMRSKREQVKKVLRSGQNIIHLRIIAHLIIEAYEASLELPEETWVDTDGNHQRYVSWGTMIRGKFIPVSLSQIPAAGYNLYGDGRGAVFSFTIKTVVDDTPTEVASVFTSLTISGDHGLVVSVDRTVVPLNTNGSPYRNVCEAIQSHVFNAIDRIQLDGSEMMLGELCTVADNCSYDF